MLKHINTPLIIATIVQTLYSQWHVFQQSPHEREVLHVSIEIKRLTIRSYNARYLFCHNGVK